MNVHYLCQIVQAKQTQKWYDFDTYRIGYRWRNPHAVSGYQKLIDGGESQKRKSTENLYPYEKEKGVYDVLFMIHLSSFPSLMVEHRYPHSEVL